MGATGRAVGKEQNKGLTFDRFRFLTDRVGQRLNTFKKTVLGIGAAAGGEGKLGKGRAVLFQTGSALDCAGGKIIEEFS